MRSKGKRSALGLLIASIVISFQSRCRYRTFHGSTADNQASSASQQNADSKVGRTVCRVASHFEISLYAQGPLSPTQIESLKERTVQLCLNQDLNAQEKAKSCRLENINCFMCVPDPNQRPFVFGENCQQLM